VLVLGSGGREHALALTLAKSSRVSSVICVPGNGGCSGGKLRRANVPRTYLVDDGDYRQAGKRSIGQTVLCPDDANITSNIHLQSFARFTTQ